jgi:DNA ligase 1
MQTIPQLAVTCKDLTKLQFPLIAEPKLDGVRCICEIRDGRVQFWSRLGKPFNNFEELERDLTGHPDVTWDGEIVAASGVFDDTISRARSHRGVNTHIDYVFHVFDCPSNNRPLQDRRNIKLPAVSRILHAPFEVVRSAQELTAQHMVHCELGFEGTMVKDPHAYYHGGRNNLWQKIKPFFSADLTIVGMSEGKGKAAGMVGRVEVKGELDDGRVVQCEVGTGFSDELRASMWRDPPSFLGRCVEIQYQEVTKDNSLRFPSFKRFRGDK